MKYGIGEQELRQAVAAQLISEAQADALLRHWQAEVAPLAAPRFTFSQVLYYFGGLIAIGAMSLFATLGFEWMGYPFLLVMALGYGLLGFALCEHLLRRKGLAVPAGICAAFGLSMVPLAIYAGQQLLGLWSDSWTADSYRDYHHYIDWRWLFMELATMAAGALALYRYRLPFLMLPIAVTGWYFSMDLARMLAGDMDFGVHRPTSMAVGLGMLALSLLIDARTRRQPDFGFWLALFGALALWGALSASDSDRWWSKHVYALINIGLIFAGALLQRRVLTVLGALGVSGYLGWLSWSVFEDSLLFPVALAALGLGLVFVGIWWQRNEARLLAPLLRNVPEWLRALHR